MRPLTIFHDDRLPQSVINVASKFDFQKRSYGFNLRDGNGVEVEHHNSCAYVTTDGYCGEHVDWEEVDILWVVRNDTNSWVKSRGVKVIKPQPVGTVIVIDINHEHSLQTNFGIHGKFGVWAAVKVAELTWFPNEKEVQKCLNQFIKKPKSRMVY